MTSVDLNQILAVGLTISQLFTQSVDQFKTEFNPQTEKEQVAELLSRGCGVLKQGLKEAAPEQTKDLDEKGIDRMIELLFQQVNRTKEQQQTNNVASTPSDSGDADDDLTMPSLERSKIEFGKNVNKIDIDGLHKAYDQFCLHKSVENPIDLTATINYFNSVFKQRDSLPKPESLKELKLAQSSTLYDRNNKSFGEINIGGIQRTWVPFSEIPEELKVAFVDTEDKRFYTHRGIDLRGILRAFQSSIQSSNRLQGGSTITQQLVKNALLNKMKDWDKVNFERKILEMYLAVRVEQVLTKDQILELYLNLIEFGKGTAGVEAASRAYFGKSVKEINLAQAAMLAALAKGPNLYNPERNPELALERRKYVLDEMKKEEDAKAKANDPTARPLALTQQTIDENKSKDLQLTYSRNKQAQYAHFFLNEVVNEAKRVNHPLSEGAFSVRTTVDPQLQNFADITLREELIRYEERSKTQKFLGPAGNIEDQMKSHDVAWDEVLARTKPQSYWDLHWPLAVILETPQTKSNRKSKGRNRGTSDWMVGLQDGSVVALTGVQAGGADRILKRFDLVHVALNGKQARLVIPPRVQGAVVVMENATGRILAMSGGFTYGAPEKNKTRPANVESKSEFNRVTQSRMQPGSTIKPVLYLAALHLNYQPNTLISNTPFHLDPIARGGKPFDPDNYSGTAYGLVTLRQALERSMNIPASRMMSKLGNTPAEGLDYLISVAQALGIYDKVDRQYPFVLGTQPARLIDMVRAYATFANDGLQPEPHVIEEISTEDSLVYRPKRFNLKPIMFDDESPNADRVAFYQLRRMLMTTMQDEADGIEIQGTSQALKDLYGYIGCKTGTTNQYKQAWFMSFNDKVTIGTWVSYDDDHERPKFDKTFTGAGVALPIGEKILRKTFELYGKRPLPGAPNEIKDDIVEVPIDRATGEYDPQGTFREVIRVDKNNGQPINTWQMALDRGEINTPMMVHMNEPAARDNSDRAPVDYGQDPESDPGFQNPFESFFSGLPF